MAVAREPEGVLQAQQSSDQSQVTEFNKIETALTNLQTVVAGFSTPQTFNSPVATPADTTVLTATASGSATPGTHSVTVTSLATEQRQVSTGVSSDSAALFNSGSFTISDGVTGDKPVTVNLAEGENSLNGIAAAINGSGANVDASVVNDGTNYRLVVTGNDANTYALDFSGLTTPPAGGTGSLVPTMLGPGDATYQAPAQAQMVVDGIDMTSPTNTVTGAIQGVTLNLESQETTTGGVTSGGTTTITVANNPAAATSEINNFVTAYNTAMTLVNSEDQYNATTSTAGVLSGNMTVLAIKGQLQSLLSTVVPGSGSGSMSSLADLGLSTDETTGALTLNSTTLASALSSNYSGVVNLFTHNGDSTVTMPTSQYGIAQQFNAAIESMVNPVVAGSGDSGSIEVAKQALNTNINDITDQISDMEVRFTAMQSNLQAQYNAMETTISGLQTQGNELLSALGISTSSSSSSS
jgi:flagellar hook-associated protein 2